MGADKTAGESYKLSIKIGSLGYRKGGQGSTPDFRIGGHVGFRLGGGKGNERKREEAFLGSEIQGVMQDYRKRKRLRVGGVYE